MSRAGAISGVVIGGGSFLHLTQPPLVRPFSAAMKLSSSSLVAFLLLLFAAVPGTQAEPPVASMSAAEMFRAYHADYRAFNARYYEKRVNLTGVVKTAAPFGDETIDTRAMVFLVAGPGPGDQVRVGFSKDTRDAALALKPGQTVTLQGVWGDDSSDGYTAPNTGISIGLVQGLVISAAVPAAVKGSGGTDAANAANSEILAIIRTLPGTTLRQGMLQLRPDLTALTGIFRERAEAERFDQYLTNKFSQEDTRTRPFPQTPAIVGVIATPIDLAPESAAKFREGVTLYKVQTTGPNVTLEGFVKANGRWYWLPK